MIHALLNNLIKGRLSCKQGIATWSVWTFLWPLWPSQCIVSRSLLYWLSCHEAYHKAIYLISLVRLIMLSFTNRQYSSRSYFTLSTCVVVALFVCLFVCLFVSTIYVSELIIVIYFTGMNVDKEEARLLLNLQLLNNVIIIKTKILLPQI